MVTNKASWEYHHSIYLKQTKLNGATNNYLK